jgi:tetratricopeptide (TPR) repeat protein
VTGRSLVGRERELDELRAGLKGALEGRAGLWLLGGDAGIGKTRLAEELAGEAEKRGATVLWGRCWEGEGAPTFWPWIQVIRSYVRGRDADALRTVMGPGAADIAQIVTDVRDRLPDLPPLHPLEAVQARFRLFDSVATFLGAATQREPLVLIFDDLHWADQDSLTLLRFVAREVRASRLLLLGTYRAVEIGTRHPLAAPLDAVAREGRRLGLRGLSESELAVLIELLRGSKPAPGLVRSVFRLTEGNPFFAGEVLNVMREEGSGGWLEIPAGIRHTIDRSLERISPASRRLLSAAAVIGREFGVEILRDVVRTMVPQSSEDLLALLDEACAAGVVAPVTATRDRYAFSHALIREALYDGLGSAERADLHRRVGESLVARATGESDAAELAHHFFSAAPAGDVEPAIEYATKAGARAAALLAFEDAAAHYEIALEALRLQRRARAGRADDGLSQRRSGLLLGLADNLMRAGERPRAKEAYLQVANLARAAKHPGLLARAALGFSGLGDATPSLDSAVVGLLEEALAALSDDTSPLRVRVQSRLSEVLYFSSAHERRSALSEEAVALAEGLGDIATLGYALNARHFALWRPQNLAERLVVADRIVDLATRSGQRELALAGHMWRIIDLLELGDVAAVDAEIETFGSLAAALRQAFNLWQLTSMRAMRALMDGRLEEGERLVQEASTLGQRARSPNVAFRFGVQLTQLRRLQGRFHELEGLIRASAERYPGIAAFRVALALLYAESGRLDEARALFECLAAHDFAAVPDDATWIGAMCHLAETCALLGDDRRAALLYRRLLPYARRNVVISFAHGCEGAVSRSLGLLARTMSDANAAARHFEEAIAMNQQMGARPFVAHSQRDYAVMLLARGAPEDAVKTQELLTEAAATYTALGMIAYAERIGRYSEQPGPQSAVGSRQVGIGVTVGESPLPTADRRLRANVVRRHGDYWTLGYEGRLIQLRDLKGLHYIAELLRHAGRDVHVMDLVDLAEAVDKRLPDRSGKVRFPTSAAPVPDASARAAYRQRLGELREELEEAEGFNDTDRAERARGELEQVTAQLGKAYGLGAARRADEPSERARKAVANRIRLVQQRLRREHPALARHLALTLHIGTFCSYRPEQPPDWDLG